MIPCSKTTSLHLGLLGLLIAAMAVIGAEPPQTAAPSPATPASPNAPRATSRRTLPKAEWLDPDRGAPNGTQYRTFQSKVLNREVSYLVYLPPGYEQEKQRYPVIYLLHGMGGNQRDGTTTYVPLIEAAIKEGAMPPTIMVLVNGMVKSFYCDSSDGQCPMESVIIQDLIPHVDQSYRTMARRESRLIEGYSMGGYGAAHLGFKYSELFGTVVINAGGLKDPSPMNIPEDEPMFGVFGADSARRAAEHPRELARKNADKLRAQTNIRIGCGSLDNLLTGNQALHELLTQLGIKHEYEIVPDVVHNSGIYYRKLGTKVFEFHRKCLQVQNKVK
jgi:enterochelin esterase-like enzyme